MVETLPYRYFLPPGADKLIIGSFPCFNGKDYGNWFYSGSGKNHFWQLMSELLNMPAGTRDEKQRLCTKYRIALTDIAYKVRRKKGNCSDANLEILEFNHKGIETCLTADIKRIFFTSRFVQTKFLKHYAHVPAETILLVSPSPAANRYIGGLQEYKDLVKQKLVSSPYQYRLFKYRKYLGEKS